MLKLTKSVGEEGGHLPCWFLGETLAPFSESLTRGLMSLLWEAKRLMACSPVLAFSGKEKLFVGGIEPGDSTTS